MRPQLALAAAAAVLAAADKAPRPAAPLINVGGIVNAASNRGAPDNYISPGSIISIYGTGLANATRDAREEDLVNGLFLPVNLAGVSVFFGRVPAPLFFVSPLQINAQVPVEIGPAVWTVLVTHTNLESTEKVLVRPYSPGLFSVARHSDGLLVSREAPAKAGEFILFFGTGFGATMPAFQTGAAAPQFPVFMIAAIEAAIGEIPLGAADIYYSGLAPGFAGLYQFNLRIPPAAPAGDLEVRVKVAEEWSQPGVRVVVAR